MTNEITREFMKDVWEYYNSFSQIELTGNTFPENYINSFSSFNFKDDFDIAYYLIPKEQLVLLFNYGLEDYKINFDYNQFIKYFIGREKLPYNRAYLGYRWKNLRCKSTKYQKKQHHRKKELTEDDVSKKNWRQLKGIYRDKRKPNYPRKYYDDYWGGSKPDKIEKIRKLEANEEIQNYLFGY